MTPALPLAIGAALSLPVVRVLSRCDTLADRGDRIAGIASALILGAIVVLTVIEWVCG